MVADQVSRYLTHNTKLADILPKESTTADEKAAIVAKPTKPTKPKSSVANNGIALPKRKRGLLSYLPFYRWSESTAENDYSQETEEMETAVGITAEVKAGAEEKAGEWLRKLYPNPNHNTKTADEIQFLVQLCGAVDVVKMLRSVKTDKSSLSEISDKMFRLIYNSHAARKVIETKFSDLNGGEFKETLTLIALATGISQDSLSQFGTVLNAREYDDWRHKTGRTGNDEFGGQGDSFGFSINELLDFLGQVSEHLRQKSFVQELTDKHYYVRGMRLGIRGCEKSEIATFNRAQGTYTLYSYIDPSEQKTCRGELFPSEGYPPIPLKETDKGKFVDDTGDDKLSAFNLNSGHRFSNEACAAVFQYFKPELKPLYLEFVRRHVPRAAAAAASETKEVVTQTYGPTYASRQAAQQAQAYMFLLQQAHAQAQIQAQQKILQQAGQQSGFAPQNILQQGTQQQQQQQQQQQTQVGYQTPQWMPQVPSLQQFQRLQQNMQQPQAGPPQI
jgi:hypothetical protein